MADALGHETLYRGAATLKVLALTKFVVCGVGAVGSLLVDMLVRMGAQTITVIDFDRVEAHNVGTQLYGARDVGLKKVTALQSLLYEATGMMVVPLDRRLDATNGDRLLRGADIVIDAFDNSASRELVAAYCKRNAACLHVGLNGGFLQVHWNKGYIVPLDPPEGNACEYPLARTVVALAATLAAEEVVSYLSSGQRRNLEMTLRDLRLTVSVVK